MLGLDRNAVEDIKLRNLQDVIESEGSRPVASGRPPGKGQPVPGSAGPPLNSAQTAGGVTAAPAARRRRVKRTSTVPAARRARPARTMPAISAPVKLRPVDARVTGAALSETVFVGGLPLLPFVTIPEVATVVVVLMVVVVELPGRVVVVVWGVVVVVV
jgi:hypothetical protein